MSESVSSSEHQPTESLPGAAGPRRWMLKLLVLLLVVFALAATRRFTLTAIGNWLDVGEPPKRSDFVMLLNGDPDTRPFEVADLYHRGKAKRVLITSTRHSGSSLMPQTHEVARSILTRCGIPDDKIDFVDSQCDNTFDEAKTLQQFMAQHPDSTFSVVTNTYHTRRTRWVLHNVLGEKMASVRIVAAKTDAFNAQNWWKNEDGFIAYLAEFLKSLFYFVRYGHGIAWVAATCGLIGIGWWMRHRSLRASTA